ncbi:SpoIIAA-like protein [Pontibacter mucosus]|uniref:SpoIIAA-like protein n=1 Tax=Pontibacter mucosus TaxID=1649266 RepID=A0A2T5YPT4_9BACT|nr:SpoIIAA-like protein [Pontibacter mucosus]
MPLPKIVLLNTPSFYIYTEAEHHLIVLQAEGTVSSETYRKGLQLATETAINQRLLYWLVDNQKSGIISIEDQIWANEVIAPRLATESSLRKMAFLEPADTFSRLILENMMDKARDIIPFEMQFFEKEEDALEWFKDEVS